MKLKKILAAVAATAVALSTMAVNSFAAITNTDDGNYVIDVMAGGYNIADVYGVKFTISEWDTSAGIGGGIGANSPSTSWESHEWGNADAGKEITLADDNTITLLKDAPIFAETDITDPGNPYAQLWLQEWWGSDIEVTDAVVLDKDGNALAPAAPAAEEAADDEAAADEAAPEETSEEAVEAPADEEAPADAEAAADETVEEAPAADTTTEAAATGNVAVASIAAVMAIAGAAAVATKKRK